MAANHNSPPAVESPPDAPPKNFNRGRRNQIMGAAVPPVADDWRAPVFSKTPEEEAALRQLLKNHVLLQGTKDADIDIVLGAFQGLRFLRGAAIITQGELGDNFYVLESGACDIWVQREGGARERVMRATPGTSFGELALLYDSPRAASVVATERCKCWALDRETFKRILMGNAVRRNARYEAFLDNVPCLQQLGRYEKLKLTDALRSQSVAAGDAVVREGTYGNDFYIIEEGEVRVTKPSRGPVEVCRRLGPRTSSASARCSRPRSARRRSRRKTHPAPRPRPRVLPPAPRPPRRHPPPRDAGVHRGRLKLGRRFQLEKMLASDFISAGAIGVPAWAAESRLERRRAASWPRGGPVVRLKSVWARQGPPLKKACS